MRVRILTYQLECVLHAVKIKAIFKILINSRVYDTQKYAKIIFQNIEKIPKDSKIFQKMRSVNVALP